MIDITRLDNNVANMMRYYRSAVISAIAEHTGYTEYEQHEINLRQHAPKVIDGEVEYALRSAHFNKAQWQKFLDRTIGFYSEEGAEIPAPTTEKPPY